MSEAIKNRLALPVDPDDDHILGQAGAQFTLVEYGSYACLHCRAANERINAVREQLGDRIRYVYRHQPLIGNDLARRAAELAERARDEDEFWEVHSLLMTRSATLTEDDLHVVTTRFGLDRDPDAVERAVQKVMRNQESALASGAFITPTYFVNNRRYDGAWDDSSLTEAMLGSLSHRVWSAASDFAGWAPSAGLSLLAATIISILLANSVFASQFNALWHQSFGFLFGHNGFSLSLFSWINDALLSVFFLVVGLEIKREFTVGSLRKIRVAAFPIAGALGGVLAPALIYRLILPSGPWAHGWGVPTATDTAFAIALLVMLGPKVPMALRIYLTAAAIADDIGSIVVVGLFYSGQVNFVLVGVAAAICAGLALLNRLRIYNVSPYLILGLGLWTALHGAGVDATLAGVLLALFIPTRSPPNFDALVVQANSIMDAEDRRAKITGSGGPSLQALRALDAIHDRLESPADRLLRDAGARSSYIVLPLFALANAGVAITPEIFAGRGQLFAAIIAGLTLGKPLGMIILAWLAVKLRLAVKPDDYSWFQFCGAAALAGIGFTMSLFIAGQAFHGALDFSAAKIAVFGGSILSSIVGITVLLVAAKARQRACANPSELLLAGSVIDADAHRVGSV